MSIQGRVGRPKSCIECGTALPSKIEHDRGRYRYTVVETKSTGQTVTHRPSAHGLRDSAEGALELKRRLMAASTLTAPQNELLEFCRTLIREIDAPTHADRVAALVVALGGEAGRLVTTGTPWAEFIAAMDLDLEARQRSDAYRAKMRRVLLDAAAVCGWVSTTDVDAAGINRFKVTLAKGGWKRDGQDAKPIKGQSIKIALQTLRAACAVGVGRGWVIPAVLDADWSYKAGPAAEREYLNNDAFGALLDACPNRWWVTAVLWSAAVGARRQDVGAARWADFDLTGAHAADYGLEPGQPSCLVRSEKTKQSRRLPITHDLAGLLADLQANPEALTSARRPRIDKTHAAYVWPIMGYKDSLAAYASKFDAIVKAAGLVDAAGKARFTLHDLRRKAATDLAKSGATLKESMAALGHRSVSIHVMKYQQADVAALVKLAQSNTGIQENIDRVKSREKPSAAAG